jgi:membrane protein
VGVAQGRSESNVVRRVEALRGGRRESVALVGAILAGVRHGATAGLLSVGVLGALWSASSGMLSVMSALNVALRSRGPSGLVAPPPHRDRAHGRLLGADPAHARPGGLRPPLASALGTRFGVGTTADWLWSLATWPIVVGATLAGVALVYSLAPAGGRRWRWITPDSAFTLAGWIAGSYLLRLYVGWFGSFNRTYGSIGAMILLMMWLYVSSLILLVGAEIDSEIARAEGRPEEAPARERTA